MPRVFKRAAARRDLVQHYVYLAENAGDAVADRFLECAESSFAALSIGRYTQPVSMGLVATFRNSS